jgi:hypothetical protein
MHLSDSSSYRRQSETPSLTSHYSNTWQFYLSAIRINEQPQPSTYNHFDYLNKLKKFTEAAH